MARSGWRGDSHLPDGRVTCASAVADSPVCATAWPGTVVAFDAGSGEQLWTQNVEPAVAPPPTIADRHVLVGASDGVVRAFEVDCGEQRWSVTLGKTALAPAVRDGVAYVPSGNAVPPSPPVNGPGVLAAVNLSGGSSQWRVGMDDGPLGPRSWATPIVGAERLYIGTGEDDVVAVDAAGGDASVLVEDVPAFPWSAPELADGTLYVANRYEGIVAIR